MANKILTEKDVKRKFAARLQCLVKAWKDIANPALDHRQRLLALWASGFYDEGYTRTHQVNLVDRGVGSIVPFLVEGNPRVLVETLFANLRPWAYVTQLALNFLIEKSNFAEEVLIPAARNSMFGAGITRTFRAYDRQISYNDELIKTGTPRVIVIDDSAYVGDCSAKTRQDVTIEGDIYRLPTDYAKELFSKDADYIQADCQLMEKYSAEEISKPDFNRNKLSVRDYSTFIDLYLYDERVVVTIMPEGKKAKILRTVEWDGPSSSPYNYLGYKFFPDSIIPLPPAWAWHDLDITMNIIMDKMKEQAESQKDLVFYSNQAEDLMKQIQKAQNLQTIRVDGDANEVNKVSFGGVSDTNLQWLGLVESQHSKAGANPDVLGGRGAQAPTFGQEKLIYNNATRIVNNMYSRFQNFTINVLRNYAWMIWTSQLEYIPVVKELQGIVEARKEVVFSQADKVGDFYDFVFKIVPYSTQRKSPEMKAQDIMQFMTQWILPSMQLASSQGAQLDVPTVSRIVADYIGIDTFNQWYKTGISQPTDALNIKMMPTKNRQKQSSDAYGTTQGNQFAQLNRDQMEQEPKRNQNINRTE